MKDISKQIKFLRIERGWTQKKLSQKVNISQATICRAETSCDNLRWKSVIKILSVLKKNNSIKLFEDNFMLREEEFFIFINELKKNAKIWTLINYDPKKTVKIFSKVVEKFFEFDKK